MKKAFLILSVVLVGCGNDDTLIPRNCGKANANKCVYEWRSLVNPDWTGTIVLECGHKRGEEGKMGNAGYIFTTDGVNILDYKSEK